MSIVDRVYHLLHVSKHPQPSLRGYILLERKGGGSAPVACQRQLGRRCDLLYMGGPRHRRRTMETARGRSRAVQGKEEGGGWRKWVERIGLRWRVEGIY